MGKSCWMARLFRNPPHLVLLLTAMFHEFCAPQISCQGGRGILLREPYQLFKPSNISVAITPHFDEKVGM